MVSSLTRVVWSLQLMYMPIKCSIFLSSAHLEVYNFRSSYVEAYGLKRTSPNNEPQIFPLLYGRSFRGTTRV